VRRAPTGRWRGASSGPACWARGALGARDTSNNGHSTAVAGGAGAGVDSSAPKDGPALARAWRRAAVVGQK
jgi:hypothetical protein